MKGPDKESATRDFRRKKIGRGHTSGTKELAGPGESTLTRDFGFVSRKKLGKRNRRRHTVPGLSKRRKAWVQGKPKGKVRHQKGVREPTNDAEGLHSSVLAATKS